MPPGQESLVIIVDYKTTTLRTNPSISVARKVGNIMLELGYSSHYSTGPKHPTTALRRDARKSDRCKSSSAPNLLLQGDFPFLGSRYPRQGEFVSSECNRVTNVTDSDAFQPGPPGFNSKASSGC